MQYVLDEKEYADLKAKADALPKISDGEYQKLMTKIADTMPVALSWDKNKKAPWMCIISANVEAYCDECPVQDICRYPSKRWSQ